jgi:hypothetical protein
MPHYAPNVKHKVPVPLLYIFMISVVNNLDCVASSDAGNNIHTNVQHPVASVIKVTINTVNATLLCIIFHWTAFFYLFNFIYLLFFFYNLLKILKESNW